MTDDFEDPRKSALRERVANAADAAGYEVDPARPPVEYPPESGLKGALKADVYSVSSEDVRFLYFVRPDGQKPLPQWLGNATRASFDIEQTEVYVVCEAAGERLRATCAAAGTGLLILRDDNTLEKQLEYGRPQETANARLFARRLKEVRTRLDTKLQLNLGDVEKRFQESKEITSGMAPKVRDQYLKAIEDQAVAWRAWGIELSERLDELAAVGDEAQLEQIEAEIVHGPEKLTEAA
jgi:hypothetical protein